MRVFLCDPGAFCFPHAQDTRLIRKAGTPFSRGAILARHARRRAGRVAARPLALLSQLRRRGPAELVMAPQDIRTADPTRADDIYAGHYLFGGRMVDARGRSPFEIPPPTFGFTRDLAGFSWLRHLRVAGTALARSNAQALIRDFFGNERRIRAGPGGEPGVAARRLLSWLCHSPFILADADAEFYRAFLRALGRDASTVASRRGETVGADRLLGAVALTQLALCAGLGPAALKRASGLLAAELSAQILPDGGHVGRNPATLVDLLLDLLPLRQVFATRHEPVPQALVGAVDRMIPMLRLLRHGDGSLALFNGMGVTEPDHVATVLAYADARGRALLHAPHAGYQRLEGGDALVIVDAGAPPPPALSHEAHAGCLSLEFSIGVDRVVVNCGAPGRGRAEAREAARQTAAHSTLSVDDTSSCRFAEPIGTEPGLGSEIIAGPREVSAERRDDAQETALDLSHDGYAAKFGLVHNRRLALSRDGSRLSGEDRLRPAPVPGETAPSRFQLRFHLHPSVSVKPAPEGAGLHLSLPSGALLAFAAEGGAISVEESIFFAAPTGAQRTLQIVIFGDANADTHVNWFFARL